MKINQRLRTTFFLAALLAYSAHAQEPTGQPLQDQSTPSTTRVSITGQVVTSITQQPISGVTVKVVGTTRGAVSRPDGTFQVTDIPAGTYQIRFSSVGYEPVVKTDVVVYNVRPATLLVEMNERTAQAEEITVRSELFQRRNDRITSVQTLGNEEIRRVPGGFEDVVRAISTLPGVAQVSNGRNDLLVRGGAPSENLYLIDNIESPNINHFGSQGAGGGPLSFVNLDFVQNITFSTGGFGTKYGDKISSVLDIDLRDGREDRTGGKATISASQFGLNLEGPVVDGGSYLFSARRSYLDFIFKAAGFSFVPEYWDFFVKANYRLGGNDQISGLAIAAIDRVVFFNDDQDDRFDNSRILDNSQDQIVAGVTWKHLFSSGYLNTTLGRTRISYAFAQSDTLLQPIFRNTSLEDELNLRVDADFLMENGMELAVGGQAKTIQFQSEITLNQSGVPTLDIRPEDRFYKGGLYAQISQPLWEGGRVNVGGRVDYFSGIDTKVYPSARFAFTQALDGQSNINLSAGRYYQSPSYIWLAANSANRSLNSIRTDVGVIGLDRTFREDLKVSIESYYKRYSNYPASIGRTFLVLANTGANFGGVDEGFASFGLEPLASAGTGLAYGAELLIQKKLSEVKCYGVISLAYGRSFFTAIDGIKRPSNFDQQVIFNISGGYQFAKNWEFGLKFRFASGRPFTPVDSTGDPSFGYQVTSQYNTQRLDASHALDIRIDKRWPFENLNLITYIDVQNVYNRQNPAPPRYDARLRGPADDSTIGLLPSIGISLEF
ncbi:MAG: carboxypeptidase-like regulatory domain-containing protein [Chlorobi bacterium]|nr:carboxypeptidase-like regulatory domain-containing protein [Chlorobiota bacterium]